MMQAWLKLIADMHLAWADYLLTLAEQGDAVEHDAQCVIVDMDAWRREHDDATH